MKKTITLLLFISYSLMAKKNEISIQESLNNTKQTVNALQQLHILKRQLKKTEEQLNPSTSFSALLQNSKQFFMGLGLGIAGKECINSSHNKDKVIPYLTISALVAANTLDRKGNMVLDPRNAKLSWFERTSLVAGTVLGFLIKGLWT